MIAEFRRVHGLLTPRQRWQGALVFVFLTGVAVVEVAGVATLLPFMAVLSHPETIHTNRGLAWAYRSFGFSSDQRFLVALGAVMFVVLVGSLTMRAAGFYATIRFTSLRNHELGSRLLRAYLYQPYTWYLNRRSGELAGKLLTEVAQVVYGAVYPTMQLVAQTLVAVLLLTLLVLVDPQLAVVAMVTLGSAYGIIFSLGRRGLARAGEERVVANAQRFHVVQESLGGIKDVKVLGLEEPFLARFRDPSMTVARAYRALRTYAEVPSFAMQAIVFGGMILVLLYLMAVRGGLTEALPTLSLYAFAGYRLMPAMQSMYAQISEIRYNSSALFALYEDAMSLAPAPTEEEARALPPPRSMPILERVEFRDVHYRYPAAEREALRGISLTIPRHAKVGLVGSSGSGKTTAVDVLLGLLRPSKGAIVVDGTPVTEAMLRDWQRTLGYVPQQIFLTDDSVTANIAFGVPSEAVDHAAVERAARIANLHDFVLRDLPKGYATEVGERGVRLSGGQRQRIGIARALYHDPEMLVLDEATSALDNVTEHAVMEAVDNIGEDKTVVLIAHRLSTVRTCDIIYVLEQGTIVAAGTYEALYASSPEFHAMAELERRSAAEAIPVAAGAV